ncbi:MAG: hypothetical protein HY664_07445 [Chloroflexi bacterium]|nr:hypothetical protein [Chloroflexota bacterium]
MLFMVTQTHTPEHCPKDEHGGDKLLFDATAKDIAIKGRYGAWSTHTIWYVVEAETYEAVQRLLDPGMKRCMTYITPIEDVTNR